MAMPCVAPIISHHCQDVNGFSCFSLSLSLDGNTHNYLMEISIETPDSSLDPTSETIPNYENPIGRSRGLFDACHSSDFKPTDPLPIPSAIVDISFTRQDDPLACPAQTPRCVTARFHPKIGEAMIPPQIVAAKDERLSARE